MVPKWCPCIPVLCRYSKVKWGNNLASIHLSWLARCIFWHCINRMLCILYTFHVTTQLTCYRFHGFCSRRFAVRTPDKVLCLSCCPSGRAVIRWPRLHSVSLLRSTLASDSESIVSSVATCDPSKPDRCRRPRRTTDDARWPMRHSLKSAQHF